MLFRKLVLEHEKFINLLMEYVDIFTGHNLSATYVVIMDLIYWQIRSSSGRGGDVAKGLDRVSLF